MQYRSKKLLSLLLAVLMIVSLLPSAAFATEGDDSVYVEYDESTPDTPVVEEEVVDEEVVNEPNDPAEGEEAPAEETPVEETPAEETPAEEDEVEEDYAPMPINDGTDEGEGEETGSATVEVASESAFYAALANGGSIKLTEDITLNGVNQYGMVASEKNTVINLNSKTLYIKKGDCLLDHTLTFQDGTIDFSGAVASSGIFRVNPFDAAAAGSLTFDNVKLQADGYNSGYAVFFIGKSSVLNITNCTLDIKNEQGTAMGGVFKSNSDNIGTVNISNNSTITLTNVSRASTWTALNISNSTIAVQGTDANETNKKMSNGFNRSALTISNSTVTMDCLSGRGITTEGQNVTVSGNSTVKITNCDEATIAKLTTTDTITVNNASSVTVDNSGTDTTAGLAGVTYTSATPAETAEVAQVGGTKYETLAAAVAAATDGCTIKLLADVTITEAVSIDAKNSITFDGGNHTITINSTDNGDGIVGLRFNNSKNPTIKNLTITGTADQAIRLGSCGQSTLENVTITGNYYTDTANYALNFANDGGGTLKNCNIVGVFKNGAGGENNVLNLESSSVTTLYLNYTENPGGIALTSDDNSTIGTLYNCIGNNYTENVHATNTVYSVARIHVTDRWYTYFSLQDAVEDAKGVENATIILMSDIEDAGAITLPANITIEGGDHTISGNTQLWINSAGGTINNINFSNITNSAGNGSPVYAASLNGKVVITNCDFNVTQWDCIQITPNTDAQINITGNTFDGEVPKRCIHIEGNRTDGVCPTFTAKVTGNKLLANTSDDTLGVYYFDVETAKENLQLSGNYIAYPNKICIANSGSESFAELALPLKALDAEGNLVDSDTTYEAAVLSGWATTFYTSLSDACSAATDGCTIKLLTDVTITEAVSIDAKNSITFDGGNHTISRNGGTILYVTGKNPTIKNLTVHSACLQDGESQGIWLNSCGQSMLENVTVTGSYTTRFGCANVDGVAFVNGGGGTLINCDVCGVFKNGQALVDDTTDGRLTIKDSTIGTMYVNAPTSVVNYQDYTAVLLDANDTTTHIGTIICRDATSFRVSDAVVNVADEIRFVIATLTVGGNTEHYTSLQAAVTAAEEAESAEIKLLADASGAGVVFAAGKHTDLTIDFNGYTYTVTGPSVGSPGSEHNAFQILRDNTVKLKNGTLTCSATSESSCKRLIQNYANLTLENMNLDGSNISDNNTVYVLSNNFGTSSITGNTSITANEGAFAFDVYDYASGGYSPAPTVTVNTTGKITGKIEVSDMATLKISGGTFTTQIEQAWCAEGFSPVSIGNGLYGVTDTPVVQKGEAAIGDTVYATLNDALTAAKASDTTCNIQLRGNVATAPAAIDFAVNIVNIGGYTIAGDLASNVLKAANGYILTDVGEMGMIFKISQDNNVYVAKIDGTQYTTVEAALAAAKSGDTVVMVADSEETGSILHVSAGVTLDLNGCTLTAAGLIAFNGAKVEDSEVRTTPGLLKTSRYNVSLSKGGSYVPLWDMESNGYIFLTFSNTNDYYQSFTSQTEDSFAVTFRPSFGSINGEYVRTKYLNTEGSNLGLTMQLQISWLGQNDTTITQTYAYTDAFFKQAYGTSSAAFTMEVTGLTDIDQVEVKVLVVSDTGAEVYGADTLVYTTPTT